MIAKNQLLENIQLVIMDISKKLGKSIPEIKYAQPLIKRWVKNNISEVDNWLKFIAEPDGTIDIGTIFDEYLEIVMDAEVAEFDIPMLGKTSIGNGSIKFVIPYVNRKVGLEYADLLDIKETLIKI